MSTEARHFVVELAKSPRSGTTLSKYVKDTRITNRGGSGGSAAARKVMNLIHRNSGHKVKSAIIHVRETTQGSNKKVFQYKAQIVKRSRTVKVPGAGKIAFNFDTKVKAI